MSPSTLYRRVAIAEAVTWALLLTGMVLEHVTHTTDLGVRIGGMVHGVVFIAYCLVTVLVAVDRRWPAARLVVGLACAVPPFATLLFEPWAERRGHLGADWRLRAQRPSGPVDQVAAAVVRRPARGALAGAVAVAALTGLALLVGPPV